MKYPAEKELAPSPSFDGYLFYIRPTLTGDEPPEVLWYRQENSEFPNDTTMNQFFDPRRFESYRRLGEHIGDELCAYLKRSTEFFETRDQSVAKWEPPTPEPPATEIERAPVPVGIGNAVHLSDGSRTDVEAIVVQAPDRDRPAQTDDVPASVADAISPELLRKQKPR